MTSPLDLLTTAEACEILGVHKSTLIRWAEAGVIDGFKPGGQTNTYLFHRADVEKLAAEKASA